MNSIWNPFSHNIDGRIINGNENNTKLKKNIPVYGRPRIYSKCVNFKTHAQFQVVNNNDSHWLFVLNEVFRYAFSALYDRDSFCKKKIKIWNLLVLKEGNIQFR